MKIKQAAAAVGMLVAMLVAAAPAGAEPARGATAVHAKPGSKAHKRPKSAKRSTKHKNGPRQGSLRGTNNLTRASG